MAGALTISTLNNDTGVLATQNGMTGIAKAWVNFNGTGTVAIRDSFNVSSITDNGTGDYTVNFTTAMPNSNYSVAGSIKGSSTGNYAVMQIASTDAASASLVRVNSMLQSGGSPVLGDSSIVNVSVFSS